MVWPWPLGSLTPPTTEGACIDSYSCLFCRFDLRPRRGAPPGRPKAPAVPPRRPPRPPRGPPPPGPPPGPPRPPRPPEADLAGIWPGFGWDGIIDGVGRLPPPPWPPWPPRPPPWGRGPPLPAPWARAAGTTSGFGPGRPPAGGASPTGAARGAHPSRRGCWRRAGTATGRGPAPPHPLRARRVAARATTGAGRGAGVGLAPARNPPGRPACGVFGAGCSGEPPGTACRRTRRSLLARGRLGARRASAGWPASRTGPGTACPRTEPGLLARGRRGCLGRRLGAGWPARRRGAGLARLAAAAGFGPGLPAPGFASPPACWPSWDA